MPSLDAVPGDVRAARFGAASAECAAAPNSGVYYHMLVWTRPVANAEIRQFTAALTAGGYTADDGDPLTLAAPPGRTFDDAGVELTLSQVAVVLDANVAVRVAGFAARSGTGWTAVRWV